MYTASSSILWLIRLPARTVGAAPPLSRRHQGHPPTQVTDMQWSRSTGAQPSGRPLRSA